MPITAARTSSRDLGRERAKQTAAPSRARANNDGDSIANSSEDREYEDHDDALDDVQSTKLQAEATFNAPAPVSHSGPTDRPEESAPPTITVKEDPFVHQDSPEAFRPDSNNYLAGVSLSWEWDGPPDFQDIAQNYEPQGELLNEASAQRSLEQDFDFREVTADSSQIQNYFTNQSRNFDLDHPPLPEQSLPHPPIQPTDPSYKPPHTAGEKRKSITATEAGPSGAQGDPAAKRVAFSTDEASVESEQPTANLQAHQYRDGGILRRGSEGPEPNASSQATASRTRSTVQQEPPPKRSKSNNRRDLRREQKMALPAGKVFPIQIGSELFRLSGASISSDAPSYFSDFFGEQLRSTEDGSAANIKTLYIDRDPITFRDISLHLQGYHVQPRDGQHFVKLFADAQFYSLPRLITQLYTSTIFIQIGERHFQIPRDIFNGPGDNPNYFSLGFAIFFSTPNDAFPGLDNRALLRPPSILPPAVLNRSADVFAELVQILQGYPIHIRNGEHRAALLRDARYFHLKGLEQKLIPHNISFNHARQQSEIIIRLQDIRQSGVSFVPDSLAPSSDQTSITSPPEGESSGSASRPSPAASSSTSNANTNPAALGRAIAGPSTQMNSGPGWIHYARPYVDDSSHHLILEIGDEATRLDLSTTPPRASFAGKTHDRVSALLAVVASKMNLSTTSQSLGLMMLASGSGIATQSVSPGNSGLSEERVKVVIEDDADVRVDGVQWDAVANVPVTSAATASGGEGVDEFEAIFEFEGREGRGRARRRRRTDGDEEMTGGISRRGTGEGGASRVWVVKNGHWRLRAQQDGRGAAEIVLVAVKIEAFTSERVRNSQREFLG